MLTDTHCHLDLYSFDNDRSEVLRRANNVGVIHILIPALNVTSSRCVVKLAESHPMLHAAIGIHPNSAATWTEDATASLRSLVLSESSTVGYRKRVVAMGEIGLDYYRDRAPRDVQRRVFQAQLHLAAELELPVIIHLREVGDAEDGPAASDLIKSLEEWTASLQSRRSPLTKQPGVLHSFSGSLETARAVMRLGFYIGVSGPVTFRKATKRQEIVAALPLEYILIETDAPFLTPHPHRGQRNEPAFVKLIADKIAEIQSRSLEEVAAVTATNAARLFAWGDKD